MAERRKVFGRVGEGSGGVGGRGEGEILGGSGKVRCRVR
jgi:hypothetical protein